MIKLHCKTFFDLIDDASFPLTYNRKFREYGIDYTGDGCSYHVLAYCPFCGSRLPTSLRDSWFDRLDALGLEPDSPLIPAELKTEMWWADSSQLG
jgi:hypothetical protein